MIIGFDARLANECKRAGVGNYCAELLRALPEAAPDLKLRLYLDAPPRAGFPLNAAAADIRVLPRRRWWTQRTLRRELRKDTPHAFFSPITRLPLQCPCPAAAVVHDLAFLSHPSSFTWSRLIRARLQAAHVVRAADVLVADSESTRREIERHYGATPGRVITAPLGCDAQFLHPPGPGLVAMVRHELKLSNQYLLYVGRIQPRKNLERLIAAFSQFRARHANSTCELVIAGDAGWLDASIRRAAAQSPVRDAIRFLGYVPASNLPALLTGAQALALVSLWEGFGLPALEAMACGTPVIASNTSSLPEVVGGAGELVDPSDTDAIAKGLERVLLDDEHRATLSRMGRARAVGFTWAATASKVAEALRSIA